MNKLLIILMLLTASSTFSEIKINQLAYPYELENSVIIDFKESNNSESLYIDVIGEIFDFTISVLVFDNETFEVSIGEELFYLDSVKNKTLVVKTSLPEGMPSEVITWKNSTGKSFRYNIQQSGMGGEEVISLD